MLQSYLERKAGKGKRLRELCIFFFLVTRELCINKYFGKLILRAFSLLQMWSLHLMLMTQRMLEGLNYLLKQGPKQI